MSEVYAPTRPTGEKIKELYLNKQAGELNTGLGDADGGMEINDGLTDAKIKWEVMIQIVLRMFKIN